jgi:cell division septation protein DedD
MWALCSQPPATGAVAAYHPIPSRFPSSSFKNTETAPAFVVHLAALPDHKKSTASQFSNAELKKRGFNHFCACNIGSFHSKTRKIILS